jgi:hypothetical protein
MLTVMSECAGFVGRFKLTITQVIAEHDFSFAFFNQDGATLLLPRLLILRRGSHGPSLNANIIERIFVIQPPDAASVNGFSPCGKQKAYPVPLCSFNAVEPSGSLRTISTRQLQLRCNNRLS